MSCMSRLWTELIQIWRHNLDNYERKGKAKLNREIVSHWDNERLLVDKKGYLGFVFLNYEKVRVYSRRVESLLFSLRH